MFPSRMDLFVPFLVLSCAAHFAVLGPGVILAGPARFAVQQAPVNIEATLVRDPGVPAPQELPKPATATARPLAEAPVVKVHRHPSPPRHPAPSAQASRGALRQAEPLADVNPAPAYPQQAREKGWEGTVVLKVLVTKTGHVATLAVARSSGYTLLDQSALNAVRTWRFLPAEAGHTAFDSWITIPVRFRLIDE